ncbi:MAG: glycoside hydrolase family 13 protein [Prevotella sp.]|nr:glycoside hydrolase family 13 protein [Prevotella sp.]
MKQLFLSLLLLMSATTLCAAKAKKPAIDRIEPAFWYAGMKNPQVQLMVYGPGVAQVNSVTTDYPGVRVDSVVALDSPNYLFVYLNVREAQPGTMTLNFKSQTTNLKPQTFELKAREMKGEEHRGFDISDVLYLLMPDRFAQGMDHSKPIPGMNAYKEDRSKPSLRHGGDMEGIRQHLDYFTDLGVTALWFTPVLENNAPDTENGFSTYHGYACTDYYKVDPRFGSNEQYRQLISDCHKRGLKVVMDMIFNHCGFEHPWVSDMPSKDWFNLQPTPDPSRTGGEADITSANTVTPLPSRTGGGGGGYILTSYKLTPVLDPYTSDVDLKETTEGWFVPSMPDLNQLNPHLMRYLIQNSKWWIEYAGIDGIRMDTYPYAFREPMADWMRELQEEYPNFNTVGETWVTEPAYTAAWQANSQLSTQNSYLKTVMDFSFFDKLNQAKNEDTDGWWNGMNRIYNSFVYDYLYPNPSSVLAFIENHDTDRFLGAGRDSLMLKQALALLLTVNRIPQLYYGTEIMMNGTKEVTDGNVRQDFPGGFPGDTQNAFTREGRTKTQQQMFGWLSRLLHWRQGNKAITHGTMKQFIPYNGVYVIARQYEDRALDAPNHVAQMNVLTVLNGTNAEATMQVSRYAEVIGSTTRAKDILTGRYYDLSKDLQLKPRQSLVLEF